MNFKNKVIITAFVILAFASASTAQSTATATATATIIAPITLTKAVDMNFGNIAVGATGGTVLLPALAVPVRVAGGGVTLPATAGTVTAAHFTVAGSLVATFAITLPSTVTLTRTSGTETMTAGSFTSTPSGTGALVAGAADIYVGATLTVGASQVAGTYISPSFNVTVNYN